MNLLSIRHLHWVLWIWLLLPEANGEDGVAKSEKRLVIKQESGPRGDSLVRSFVQTRVSRAFSSTSTFDDGRDEDIKPPDDRQSTIRIKNETVDLSKNTVPVLKYPGPTEPSLKDKYKRTTSPAETTPLKKSFKLKRNMTRPRPADMTTLLAFKALTPSPPPRESDQPRYTGRPKGYLSTTQVAESMPPTAWALASLKGPSETTRKPGSPYVKPFVSWSTRLSKPTTTPTPTTEVIEPVTGTVETPADLDTIETHITGEGVDRTETTAIPTEDTPTLTSASTDASSDVKMLNNTVAQADSISGSTEKPQDITSYKPEENTISVPPLSSLKNLTHEEIAGKSDVLTKSDVKTIETNLPQITGAHEIDSSSSEEPSSSMGTVIYSPENTRPTNSQDTLNLGQFNISREVLNSSLPSMDSGIPAEISNSSDSPLVTLQFEGTLESLVGNQTKVILEPEIRRSDPMVLNTTEPNIPSNNSILTDEEVKKSITHSKEKEISVVLTTAPPIMDETRLNEKILTEKPTFSLDQGIVPAVSTSNDTVHELDPSINTINEKKGSELSTSTVISSVNSTATVQMASPMVTTPGNVNLTNLVEEELKKSGNQLELAKNLPLTAETTTVSSTTHSVSATLPILNNDFQYPQEVHDHEIINQTSNYIKPISGAKLVPLPFESNTETTSSTRSNEIKQQVISSNSNLNATNDTEISHKLHDLPETTQSNYIQVQESVKPQNKSVIPHFNSVEDTEKQKDFETPPPMTTLRPTTIPTTIIPSPNISIPLLEPENITLENITTTDSTTIMTTTPLPTTTTLLPSTTIVPTVTVTLPTSTFVKSTSPTSLTPSSTTKSNDIKDQENLSDINLPISEKNMTQLQYESPNASKNESTPLIIQDPDDIDEEEVAYNHTDFSDKKNPSDAIQPGDDEDDSGDSFHDVLGNSSISLNNFNSTKDVSSTSSTTFAPTSKITSTSSSMDDVIPTQTDEEQSNIDEETIYDTSVIMPVYIRVTFDANYGQLCREKDQLRDAIVRIFKKYAERTVDKRQVMLINLGLRECLSLRGEMDERHYPVHLMLTDGQGQYDKSLNDQFVSLVRQRHFEFKYPITQVEKIIEHHELSIDTDNQPSGTVVAAIIISSIAAVCLFALTILLVIMRKRQTGFNYGQRCTPVSLDDYSLDNISVYNSVRRKALRASKRSYGNPAFDDPDAISNPVNFAGLANMASDRSKTDEEFSSLPQVIVKPDELPPGAESKNRYANVIPLPETRVHLRGNSLQEQFINANYVKGAKGADKFYIACQAPLQSTVEDFWQMIWDEQCRLIIMLTALSENGVEKCVDYLPPSEVLDCHRVFGDLQVTLKKREAREKYVIASLQLKNLESNLWREVTHMWYAGWPPTGVPQEPSSIIAFLIEARSYSKGAPIVVHCSPGTGRTGTVIAIDIAIRDFEAGRSVDIPKTVVQVRRGRAGAVQTKEQYHFIYKVLHLYATKLTGGGLDSI